MTTADKKLYNCCLFLDLSKAFDTVDHKILLWKLERYFGFRGPSLDLFRDYLNNRYQYTKIATCESNLLNVTCGVPQGSSLSPLLFLTYINDLLSASELSTSLFADDTYLNMSDANLELLQSWVNCELNKINNWFSRNKLSLSYQKSNYVPVLINKVPQKSISAPFPLTSNKALVERKKAVKYLGLYIDENLSWSSHIKELSLQLARSSGIVYKLRKFVSVDTLHTVLCALVYSCLQYGITV